MTANIASPTIQPQLSLSAPRQRILALVFPHLPTDRIARRKWGPSWRLNGRPDHPPLLCAGRRDNALRITALDELSHGLGLKMGQGMAEARAMFPDIDFLDEDEAADHAFLQALADWCDRYTPLVALDGCDGLFLDITGCSHLFGGEERMLKDILTRLFQLGLDARAAISSAPALSWACCRFGRGGIVAEEAAAAVVAALPVDALRIGTVAVTGLRKLGLKRVGDLTDMPRAMLTRRFGGQLLVRLDQLLGRNEEAISPRRPVAALSAERQLMEPVQAEEHVLDIVGQVAPLLVPGMESRGIGGRVFELVLFRVDGKVFRIGAKSSQPLREPRRISGLFAERLFALHDDLDAGFGFELVRLNVLEHESFRAEQGDLSGDGGMEGMLADFIDQVSARLGAECLQVFDMRQSHIPEHATVFVPAIMLRAPMRREQDLPFLPKTDRPLRLLRHPEPMEAFVATVPDGPPQRFRWRRVIHRVTRAEGPERISSEWWREPRQEERDYFRLESEGGRRFWIFRSGRYDAGNPPQWHVHGIFA